MTRAIVSADSARATALEDCENKIKSAFRRGLEATCTIAKELSKIYREELYTVKTEEWNDYIVHYQRMDLRTYRRIVAVSQTVHQLQDAGLQLPANETQVAELARLDVTLRPKIWNDLVIQAEQDEKSLTVEDIRRAVDIAEQAAPEAPRAGGGGVEVGMDLDDNNGAEPAALPAKKKEGVVRDAELLLSEKGEAALNRIRKICGDIIADAIEDGTKAMTEREIKNWAEYDDAMMRSLVYLVMDCKYPLNKAVNFITRDIDGSTDVKDLVLIAHARGGTASINYDNRARIVIELTKK